MPFSQLAHELAQRSSSGAIAQGRARYSEPRVGGRLYLRPNTAPEPSCFARGARISRSLAVPRNGPTVGFSSVSRRRVAPAPAADAGATEAALKAEAELKAYEARPIARAAWTGDAPLLVRLLDCLDERPWLVTNTADHDGNTPLIGACLAGSVPCVEALLRTPRLAVNHANLDGDTALIVAASHGHWRVVDCLLNHDIAGVNHANREGGTALIAACRAGHARACERITQTPKVDLDAANWAGDTATGLARARGHAACEAALAHARTPWARAWRAAGAPKSLEPKPGEKPPPALAKLALQLSRPGGARLVKGEELSAEEIAERKIAKIRIYGHEAADTPADAKSAPGGALQLSALKMLGGG